METQSNRPLSPAESNGKLAAPDYLVQPSVSEEAEDWNSQQLLAILRRRAALMAGVAVVATSGISVLALNQKPIYKSEFQVLVEPVTAEKLSQFNQTNNNNNQNNQNQGSALDYPTQIQVLLSPKILQPIAKQIQLEHPEVSYGDLVANLKIDQPPDTKIIAVSYQDTDPQRVKAVLDQVSQGYLRYSQQERQSTLREGIKFVNSQVNQTQKRVDTLQRQLQNFRQKNNFVDPETQVTQVSSQINTLLQQKLETEKQLAEARKSYSNLQGRSGAVSALAADTAYQSLLSQLRDLDSKIAAETARFQDDNPAVEALRAQRQNLLPVLRQEARRVLGNKLAEIDNQLSILETRQQATTQAQNFLDQQGKRLPVIARLYTDLQRDLTVATDSLKRFLAIRESLQVQAAQQEVPWQLIAPPEQPGAPDNSRGRTLLLGAIAGLLLSVAAALIAERTDSTIRTIEDLRKQTKLPLLGRIPHNADLRNSQAADIIPQLNSLGRLFQSSASGYSHQLFPEAFRSLHTNVRLLKANPPIRSLVISSALPGEGKSTVSTHLAQAAAAMGQRVLLVDADLRNPQVSSLLDLPDVSGLSDLLETDLHPEQVIRPVYQTIPALAGETQLEPTPENLFVVASGQIPLDPTKLLASHKMRQVVDYFQTVFDLVIYDTPPLLTLADSSLLAAHTDGMMLVIGLGETDRSSLAQALDKLKTARISVLGTIANSVH